MIWLCLRLLSFAKEVSDWRLLQSDENHSNHSAADYITRRICLTLGTGRCLCQLPILHWVQINRSRINFFSIFDPSTGPETHLWAEGKYSVHHSKRQFGTSLPTFPGKHDALKSLLTAASLGQSLVIQQRDGWCKWRTHAVTAWGAQDACRHAGSEGFDSICGPFQC